MSSLVCPVFPLSQSTQDSIERREALYFLSCYECKRRTRPARGKLRGIQPQEWGRRGKRAVVTRSHISRYVFLGWPPQSVHTLCDLFIKIRKDGLVACLSVSPLLVPTVRSRAPRSTEKLQGRRENNLKVKTEGAWKSLPSTPTETDERSHKSFTKIKVLCCLWRENNNDLQHVCPLACVHLSRQIWSGMKWQMLFSSVFLLFQWSQYFVTAPVLGNSERWSQDGRWETREQH